MIKAKKLVVVGAAFLLSLGTVATVQANVFASLVEITYTGTFPATISYYLN